MAAVTNVANTPRLATAGRNHAMICQKTHLLIIIYMWLLRNKIRVWLYLPSRQLHTLIYLHTYSKRNKQNKLNIENGAKWKFFWRILTQPYFFLIHRQARRLAKYHIVRYQETCEISKLQLTFNFELNVISSDIRIEVHSMLFEIWMS